MYYQLNYYYANREDYLKKYRQRVKCPICGCEMRLSSLNQHYTTIKCQFYKKNGYFPIYEKKSNYIKKEKKEIKPIEKKIFKPEDFILHFN
jgi:ssDNA-binding Zn-finger/Zn-ribbon topoisomerase 1